MEVLESRQLMSVTLSGPASIGAGIGPQAIATADLNGDGIADFVTADRTGNLITVNKSSSMGGYEQSVYTTLPQPVAVAIANFDGDTKPDVAVICQGSSTVMTFHNTGDGLSLTGAYPAGAGSSSIIAADFTSDGVTDLLVTNPLSSSYSLFTGLGNGLFNPALDNPMPAPPEQAAAADFDGDGHMDVALSTSNGITINLNNGTGIFSQVSAIATGQSVTALTAADVNGDGRPDLVGALAGQGGVDVMINNADGSFSTTTYPIFSIAQSVSVADINGDGTPDLVLAEPSIGVGILENHGNGTFGPESNYSSGNLSFGAVVADANFDGRPDVVATAFADNAINVLASNGVISSATQLGFRPVPAQVGGPVLASFQVLAEDSDGGVDTDTSSTAVVSLASGPRNGVLSGILTMPMVHGVATFSAASVSANGVYTLQANDGALTPGVSGSFAVGAKLAFQKPLKNTMAGAATPVTVLVEDAAGHVLTSNHSLVTIAIATGPGGLTGTTSVAAIHGVATFSLGMTVSGPYTLIATDGAFKPVTSNSFQCLAGTVSSAVALTILSGNNTAGTKLPVQKFELFDSFGNLANNDHTTFTAAVGFGPAGGSLTGALTAKAGSGILTFSNLVLKLAGTYALNISNGTASAGTGSFHIVAAAARKLVFLAQPTTTEAGWAMSPAVAVNILDSFGNLVVKSTASVTIGAITGVLASSTAAVSGGTATFAGLVPSKAGTFTLKATSAGLTGATSAPFAVQPAATHLVFGQQPGNAALAFLIVPMVTVRVLDQFGNLVTADHSTVTLTPPAGILVAGNVAPVINGLASFPSLMPFSLGTFALTASDDVLTPILSSPFTVNPLFP